LSSALIAKARSLPLSCQAYSETLPNVVSRPCELAHDQRRARRAGVVARGAFGSRPRPLWRVTAHGEVCAARVEGESVDCVDRRGVAGSEVEQPQLSLNRLFLRAQLLFLRF
jgi:hypothetical protein